MEIYLVGGALRDELLGLTPKERDWVVVGGHPKDLIAKGFKQVGKSFPVFLHPESHEEHALARTEVKTGPGYTGFDVNAAPDVTLEQDLLRRDLTINAIARTDDGNIIDPFDGRSDIKKHILRHVSPAFNEDPVRVLRVARFCAQLGQFDFTVATETLTLMADMVDNGEVDALVAERVWRETEQALISSHPHRFFETLRACGALAKLFPEVDCLFGVPQPEKHHPEIDTGIHTMMVIEQAAKLSDDIAVRFAALVHDLGKGTTPKELWPKHVDHESRSVPLVAALCDRLRVPSHIRDIASGVAKYHLYYHRAGELKPKTFIKLFNALDLFRRPERFEPFLLTCEADSRGRTGFENRRCEQSDILKTAFTAASSVNAKSLVQSGIVGAKIKTALDKNRITAVAAAIKEL